MLTAPADLRVHLSTLLVGLHWLYDTEQPTGAAITLHNHGQSLASAAGWRFTFIPAGPTGAPMIMVDAPSGLQLSDGDMDQLADDIDDFGITVRRTSLSGGRGVVELTGQAHPSLLRAIASGTAGPAGASRAVGLIDLQQQTQPQGQRRLTPSEGAAAQRRHSRAVHRSRPAGLGLRCPHRRH